MFTTLRSRLLLSYLAVIATVLFIVALALAAVSLSQSARILPTLRQLNAIGQATQRELVRLTEQGVDPAVQARALDQIAAEQDTRILVVDRGSGQVLYDSSHAGLATLNLDAVRRPRGEFPTLDASLPFGSLQAPDGARWLIYSLPLGARNGRLLAIFARPEPAPLQVFRETFLRPLCQAGLVALLLAVLLAVLISRSVARPLQTMAVAAESIAQGEYNQQIPLRGPDEVQRVAASFNTMAAQVQATHQAQRDFVANVSHDLKTPLTSIQGWSQAILDGAAATPEQQQRAAGIIHGEAERMGRMVGQLLELARIESGQLQLARQPVDIGQLVGDVHRSLALRAQEKEIHFTLETAAVPPVPGDHDRLVQIFSNLVDNALAHTPAGGRIHLSLRPYGDKAVEVVVQDTGPGIPPDELSRIFERFYQVDKARARNDGRRGAGLGLAIVKELVEAHGGRITARSQMGQGSAFVVRLPTAPPEASTVTQRR
ncbi:MAG: HAMP domain-containing histidine kinase [Chloroflexi bacterium]|nr:HAMP domain-containing histidine kinase [Chloroflexota bacterium]MCI0580818.1 HAMP domain-containing histidine kinase [Chloroflexota bacterium]MCI0648188.1 HAMP domain-containing histidine kinase [Chloroflexota bacterium]MCI0730330.1 HAMP domain-containing histidine kinase [Chloroflexota bacterium]